MMHRFMPNPLVNKRLRRIRALRKKLEKPYKMSTQAIKEAEREIERQYKMMPKLVYETNRVRSQPAINVEMNGEKSYIPKNEYEQMVRNGEIQFV